MILIIDNYDSFTYNLVQQFERYYTPVKVIQNNTLTINEIISLDPKAIVLSPGPCTPDDAGICLEVVREFYKRVPILGICLGHQIIAQAFGGQVIKAKHLVHGRVDEISHDFKGLFFQLPQKFLATRYHSLIVDDIGFPNDLMITARSKSDAYIMGIRHQHYPIEGLQFHPESYKTDVGDQLICNFIEIARVGGYHV